MNDVTVVVLIAWWAILLLYDAIRTIGYIDRPSRDLPCDTDEGGAEWSGSVSFSEWQRLPW